MRDLLQRQIEVVIKQECADQTQCNAILRALTRPGFALHQDATCRAGALTLEIYRTVTGRVCDSAISGAVGVELLMESCFMFDHVGDQEIDPQYGLSPAEEIALAIALLSIGVAAAYKAEKELVSGTLELYPLQPFLASFLNACAGQFLDTHMERSDGSNTDDALRMTTLKAGSLGSLAAGFGASLGTGDSQIIAMFDEFGFNLFTYLQLIDDLRDACPSQGEHSDLSQNKMTVPLVFFYNALADGHSDGGGGGGTMPLDAPVQVGADIRKEFEASGAPAFGAIIAETYLNRAKSNLADLQSQLGRVETLEYLLTSLEISPSEIVVAP